MVPLTRSRTLSHSAPLFVFMTLCALGAATPVSAQQPTSQVLAFTGAIPGQPDGPVDVRLRLYDANTGGTRLFEEVQTVTVASQAFTVRVGDATASGVPATLFRDNLSLWIAFALDSAPDMEIGPRTPITSGGYAHYAQVAGLLTSPMVRTLNSLVGDVALAAGTNVTITPSGNTLTIDAAGSGGLPSVSHDATLTGNGTVGVPLQVAAPLQLTANTGVAVGTIYGINTSGTGVRGDSNSSQGVLGVSNTWRGVFGQSNTGSGVGGLSTSGVGVSGGSTSGAGVSGSSQNNVGVVGQTSSTATNVAGVRGEAIASSGQVVGVFGTATVSPIGTGVVGTGSATGGFFQATTGSGVIGQTSSTSINVAGVSGQISASNPGAFSAGVRGINQGTAGLGIGVWGSHNGSGWGVYGTSVSGTGAFGQSTDGAGVLGQSANGDGVFGTSSGTGVHGQTAGMSSGVLGENTSGGSAGGHGVIGSATSTGAAGVYGVNPNGYGIWGDGPLAVFGRTSVDGWAGIFSGRVQVEQLDVAGNTPLCQNFRSAISPCSSSLRYKTGVRPFTGGLEIVNRLRPIAFTWKSAGTDDIGLGAEEVADVEPLLTFRNHAGEIEGVKYSQLSAVFVNAFVEQQAEIKQLWAQIAELQKQQTQVDALKALVCGSHPDADACR